MPRNVVVLLDNQTGRRMVKKACEANGFKLSEFEKLLQIEIEQTGKQRRVGLWGSFDEIIDNIQVGN